MSYCGDRARRRRAETAARFRQSGDGCHLGESFSGHAIAVCSGVARYDPRSSSVSIRMLCGQNVVPPLADVGLLNAVHAFPPAANPPRTETLTDCEGCSVARYVNGRRLPTAPV